jgi:hypothetical protein
LKHSNEPRDWRRPLSFTHDRPSSFRLLLRRLELRAAAAIVAGKELHADRPLHRINHPTDEQNGSGHPPPCSPSASPSLRLHELAAFPLVPISVNSTTAASDQNLLSPVRLSALYLLYKLLYTVAHLADHFSLLSGRPRGSAPRRPPPPQPAIVDSFVGTPSASYSTTRICPKVH